MILQALTRLYEDLHQQGKLPPPGWNNVNTSYSLCLDKNGQLFCVIPLLNPVQNEKKTIMRPQSMVLPSPVKRSSDVRANFLWDNSSYILGFDNKGKPQRSLECFEASKNLHHKILDGIDSPAAHAVLCFFDTWNPQEALTHPELANFIEDLFRGGNLVFDIDGVYAHEDALIQSAWDQYYAGLKGPVMQCMVTGKTGFIELTHPLIKGIQGAQPGGASLVSFNANAYSSYGKEQGENAPVSRYAAFAYSSALNALLADYKNVNRIDTTTIVAWAEGANPNYTAIWNAASLGSPPPHSITNKELRDIVARLADGKPCPELNLTDDRPFYILGLEPNSARISVRFFYQSKFSSLMDNVNRHNERLSIEGNPFDFTPLWALLRATLPTPENGKAWDDPNPAIAGAVLRAIYSNAPYPTALAAAIIQRIRAEHSISPTQAGILKAYLLNNPSRNEPSADIKEVADVQLSKSSRNQPYLLGRLFAVLEKIQLASAEWQLNKTIKDTFFTAITESPNLILKKLITLSEHHIKKLNRTKPYLARTLDLERTEIFSKINSPFSSRFTAEESICFYLGYYHQMNTDKEDQ